MVYFVAAYPQPQIPHARGMKKTLKFGLHALFLALSLPAAAFAGFGRFSATFTMGAHAFAQIPGIVGDYFRIAYYKLTLQRCSLHSRVSYGPFFAHSDAALGQGVYVG